MDVLLCLRGGLCLDLGTGTEVGKDTIENPRTHAVSQLRQNLAEMAAAGNDPSTARIWRAMASPDGGMRQAGVEGRLQKAARGAYGAFVWASRRRVLLHRAVRRCKRLRGTAVCLSTLQLELIHFDCDDAWAACQGGACTAGLIPSTPPPQI